MGMCLYPPFNSLQLTNGLKKKYELLVQILEMPHGSVQGVVAEVAGPAPDVLGDSQWLLPYILKLHFV